MKTLMMTILSAALLALAACEKEDVAPRLRKEAEEKIMGTWKLERRVSEVYEPIPSHPVPGTGATVEYTGTASDYFHFKQDLNVVIDTAAAGAYEVSFGVINPSQVGIGSDVWRIEELTTSKLLLVRDRNDGAQNKRFITKLYLKK